MDKPVSKRRRIINLGRALREACGGPSVCSTCKSNIKEKS